MFFMWREGGWVLVEMFEQHREEAKWAKATGSEGEREVHTCLKRRQVIKCEHEGVGFTFIE